MNINYSKNSIDFITITVTFDQFNVFLMDKSIYFFFSFTKKTDPKRLIGSVHLEQDFQLTIN